MNKVLVVDDDKDLQQSVKDALEHHNFKVEVANNGKEAVGAIYRDRYDLVVMDVNMPEMSGIEALVEIKKFDPSIIVIILTAYSNVSDAVKVVKEGAYNYLEKPITSENLVSLIKRALKAKSLVETSMLSAPKLSLGKGQDENQFVGESDEMKKVFNLISKLAKVTTPVLIRGESGTGKELVAKAIHFNGPRKDGKFVTINCAAIPENLIESELFGHEKGAFTGASERKIGKFQYADGGTLFLDEIGDVSSGMQVKLLRALQEKTFTPVGANREVTVDVRVIAASHRHFEEMIQEGTFREDLFYRLNVLPVYLPPLRERKSDIGILSKYYIDYFNKMHNLSIMGLSTDAEKSLKEYRWPGNIRELRNVIEHAFIVESSDLISINSLPEHVTQIHSSKNNDDEVSIIDIDEIKDSILDDEINSANRSDYHFTFALQNHEGNVLLDFQQAKDMFEKEFIVQALKINNGRINQTALKANIPKKTLLRKIEKYEINPRDYYK